VPELPNAHEGSSMACSAKLSVISLNLVIGGLFPISSLTDSGLNRFTSIGPQPKEGKIAMRRRSHTLRCVDKTRVGPPKRPPKRRGPS
jgi:hypothetical protein